MNDLKQIALSRMEQCAACGLPVDRWDGYCMDPIEPHRIMHPECQFVPTVWGPLPLRGVGMLLHDN